MRMLLRRWNYGRIFNSLLPSCSYLSLVYISSIQLSSFRQFELC